MRRHHPHVVRNAERVEHLATAWLMVSQSDLEPMMIATSGLAEGSDMAGIVAERDDVRPSRSRLIIAPHRGLEHELAALVGHLVPVGHDAAIGLLGLALVGDVTATPIVSPASTGAAMRISLPR